MCSKAENELIKLKLLYPDMVYGKDIGNENNIILKSYKDNAETLILPSSIKKIGKECFMGNKHVKHIKMLSRDFIILYNGAFCNSGLCSIELQAKNVVIGRQAFYFCDELRNIDLDKCTELGRQSFKNSGLVEINISENIIYPDLQGLCEGAVNLKKAKIGKQIKCIERYMFNGCESLTDIELPDGLKKISYGSFGETRIKEIVLPASLEEIEDAFGGSDLEHIVIKGNNLELNKCLFVGVSNLKYITANRDMIDRLKQISSRFDSIQYNYID